MNTSDFKTIVLIDDLKITYVGGGEGSADRKSRYKVFFQKICQELKKVNSVYLILGDGVFNYNKDEIDITKKADFEFPKNTDESSIVNLVKDYTNTANKEFTLLLVDFRLASEKKEQKRGEHLAMNVLLATQYNYICQILYSGLPIDRNEITTEITNNKYFRYIYRKFQMDNPSGMADLVLKALGEMCS
jgi:hypothetical protein